MGLFDFLKRKKKKAEAEAENAAAEVMELDDSELEGIEPPETRYTEEYKEYLAKLEAAREGVPEERAFDDPGGEAEEGSEDEDAEDGE